MLSYDYLLNIEHIGAVALSLAYLWYKVKDRFKPVSSGSKLPRPVEITLTPVEVTVSEIQLKPAEDLV